MAKWDYTLEWGKQLREAIEAEDITMVGKCLIACYHELLNKLSDEDKEWYEFYIEDAIGTIDIFVTCVDLNGVEDEDQDEIDGYLEEFYDTCDELGAWVEI